MDRLRTISTLTLILFPGCANLRTAVHSNWLNRPSPTIAVLPFNGEEPFNETMPDALVTELLGKGFSVMERSHVSQIMKEHNFQYSGAFDPTTLARTGQLIGVDYIVVGSLTTRPVVTAWEWFLGEGKPEIQIDTVHLRWIGVENGQVLASVNYRNFPTGRTNTIAKKITQSLNQGIQSLNETKKTRPSNNNSIQLTAYKSTQFAQK